MRSPEQIVFLIFTACFVCPELFAFPVGEGTKCEVSNRGQCVDEITYRLRGNKISEIKSVVLYKELNGNRVHIGECDWMSYFNCEASPGYTWNQTTTSFSVRVVDAACPNGTFTISINGQKPLPCETPQEHSKEELSRSSPEVQQETNTGCQDDDTRDRDDIGKQIGKRVAVKCQNTPDNTDNKSEDNQNTTLIAVSILCGLLICLSAIFGVVLFKKCQMRQNKNGKTSDPADTTLLARKEEKPQCVNDEASPEPAEKNEKEPFC